MASVVTIRLMVQGRVQGVSYRRWTAAKAREYGLSGWVRNRRDGSVELVLSGAADAVETMKQACYKGPALARVTQIDTEPYLEEVAPGFKTCPTL